MHLFPSDEKVREQWVKFVHKHRPDFVPKKTLVLCSIYFTPDCSTWRLDLAKSEYSSPGHRHLIKGSVPIIDAAVNPLDEPSLTDREPRMVSGNYSDYTECLSWNLSVREDFHNSFLSFTEIYLLNMDDERDVKFHAFFFCWTIITGCSCGAKWARCWHQTATCARNWRSHTKSIFWRQWCTWNRGWNSSWSWKAPKSSNV